MSEPEELRPAMACNHGDEGKADCDALRAEVCAALRCQPDRLVTAVVEDLHWEHDVEIVGIPTDMWSAVKSEYRRYVAEEEWALPEGASTADEWITVATAYIECDRIEDGFALTWKTWTEWFEAKEKVNHAVD